MPALPETSSQTFDLSAYLDRLVDPNRKILQLFAIIYDTVPASLIVACLKKLKLKQTPQSWFTVRTLQPRIDILLGLALLKKDLETGLHFRIVPAIADAVVMQAIKDGVCEEMMQIVNSEIPALLGSSRGSPPRLVSFNHAVREIRLGLLTNNTETAIRFLGLALSQRPDDYRKNLPLVHLCSEPWDLQRMAQLPLQVQLWALEEIVEIKLLDQQSVAEIVPLLEQHRQESCPKTGPGLRALYLIVLLVQGHIKTAEEILAGEEPVEAAKLFQGWIHFLRGDFRRAINTLDKTMVLLDDVREENRHRIFPHYWGGLFLLLALLQTNQFEGRQRILSLVQRLERHRHNPLAAGYQAIRAVVVARGGDADQALNILGYRSEISKGGVGLPWLRQEFTPLLAAREGGWSMALPKSLRPANPAGLAELLRLMALHWVDHETMTVEAVKDHLWAIHRQALNNDYLWAALESAALLRQWPEEEEEFATVVSELETKLGFSSIVGRIRREERWEQTLSALLKLTGGQENEGEEIPGTAKRRLVWLIETHGQRGSIQAREQILSEDGEWSRGKSVSPRKLYSSEAQLWGFLSAQDLKVCQTIRQEYIYNGTRYDFEWARGMLALVGHPQVYWLDNPMVTIEVIRAEPELLVNEHNGRVKIRFAQKIDGPGVLVLREGERRCRVIEITNDHHKIADILGPDGFNGPDSQKARVMGVVARLANLVTIQSAVDADVAEIDEVPTDSRPRLQLVPQGSGLVVRLLVRPFADAGPWCNPGRGGVLLFAEREGKRVRTRRNFRKEKELSEELISQCPTLAGRSEDDSGWLLPQLEECLELLLELKELGDKVLVEWPEGERFRVAQTLSVDKLHIKIRRERDWFAVAGTVTLDDAMVLEMSNLLKLSQKGESRFIALGNGQFAALTEAFRRRLLEMLDRGEETGKGWRVHALTAPWLRELVEESGRVTGDKHWKDQVSRLEAMESDDAEIPSTFQAELRDYQKIGFQWLHRLSVWGVGGCLADDMGLGKTLQAMTLLLSRAPDGVGLVVAPTSVCSNWESEIKRFAPTLKPILFGGSNRKEMVTGLQAFDVLVVSYALLQIEGELLGQVSWHTIVLDEAQAIKNRMTKRSQSAMALKGDFRVITTGTPIENHLGELWNLFRFLNPGLLGSLERFNERFAVPIERFRDREASRRLKEIIRPFILRRTKNQVLQELPPLTEIVLHVEMSPEESAFYEALRQQAMSNLEGVHGKDGKNHLAILAELMTLRRACCNSRLIKPDVPWPCSKLETFKEVARTLLDNKHKALVFSQFVDHLSIIREFFDSEGIHYRYLDGSTPAPQRKKNIDAFQGGKGDFFLISLKAGGVGLNLTAADYVIHMDPWWNPAVEDQASNRAHRFGQERPVTVYRLVTRGTIEEKIVELHAQKRDLADDLLEGGDKSGRLSAQELLNLIQVPLK